MPGTPDESQNAFSIQMDFQLYISDFLRETCGFVRVLKQDPNNPTVFFENYFKPDEYKDMRFLCDLDGGLVITHALHQFLNKHLILGNIRKESISRKAGEIVRQTFGDMIFEPELYNISDLDAFANKALTVQDQLEMFFTNISNSGIRDWSRSILTIQQRQGGDMQPIYQEPERKGLLERIRGGKDI